MRRSSKSRLSTACDSCSARPATAAPNPARSRPARSAPVPNGPRRARACAWQRTRQSTQTQWLRAPLGNTCLSHGPARPRPVRDVRHSTAKVRQVPRTAGVAGLLQQRDQAEAQQSSRHDLPALSSRQFSPGSDGPKHQQQQTGEHRPAQPLHVLVQQLLHAIRMLKWKVRQATHVRSQWHVQASCVPSQHHAQAQQNSTQQRVAAECQREQAMHGPHARHRG